MFQHLRLRGGAAAILWGYRTAATLRSWSIAKVKGQWTLSATIERADAFQCRQTSLLFAAPREDAHKGFWAWPVDGEIRVEGGTLKAKLGPPEQ